MLDGLLESLKEILQNGGIVRVCGLAMTPRIILMTDGEPTDSAGSVEGKKKVVAAALGFGPGWRQLGLPHPVPIACVGCGSCDTELLEAIAKITNGMYVIVGNVTELSTFFRRQVLLIRFAMQFAAGVCNMLINSHPLEIILYSTTCVTYNLPKINNTPCIHQSVLAPHI
jgi:hypothetical protein